MNGAPPHPSTDHLATREALRKAPSLRTALFFLVLALGACSASSSSTTDNPDGGGPAEDAGAATSDASSPADADAAVPEDSAAPPDAATPKPPLVYAVTVAAQLFAIDLVTRQATPVGFFKGEGCNGASPRDIAIDDKLQALASSDVGMLSIDLKSGACKRLANNNWPGTMTFLPKQGAEQPLVGFLLRSYRRVQPTALSTVMGAIEGYDPHSIVATASGRLFVGASGSGCTSCLLEVDPATGALKKSYGEIGRTSMALFNWGETLYGVGSGKLYSIVVGNTITVTDLGPLDVGFVGASAVAAP